jgi:hypothetical protein
MPIEVWAKLIVIGYGLIKGMLISLTHEPCPFGGASLSMSMIIYGTVSPGRNAIHAQVVVTCDQ